MKILKQISLFTLAGFFGAGVNFFVLPILSHYLTPLDYGLLSIFNSYVTILIPIVGLVSSSILSVDFFKVKDSTEFASRFASIQVIPIIPFLVLSTVFFTLFSSISEILELGSMDSSWSLGMLFLALATIYIETFFTILILKKEPKYYALLSILKVSLEISITIFLVIYCEWGWRGRLVAWLVTSILFLAISLIYFHKQGFLHGKIRWHFMKEAILFGMPLILHTVGKFVINQSDRLFIAKMISLDQAGIYNLGYTVGTLILIAIDAFFYFYTPFVMERLAELDELGKLQIVKLSYFFGIAVSALLVIMSLLVPYFFKFFIDAKYASAGEYVFWVGLGYLFWGGYMLSAIYIFFFKRNRILGWLSVLNVSLNMLFNYYFISWFGAIGAAYATCLSFFIVFIVIFTQSNRLVQLPWLQLRRVMHVKL